MRPLGRRARVLALLVIGVGLRPTPSIAGDSTSVAPPSSLGVSLSGLVTTSYGYNFNRPYTRRNVLRVFDVEDNSFTLDNVELVAQHAVSKPRESGFRVDLAIGGSVAHVTAAQGLFGGALAGSDIDLHQAFVSYVAPIGSGLRFDAGKFVTHFGYEVIDGPDNWNPNATRSLLFGYSIPFTHTGVRASFMFNRAVSGMLMVVNGWDLARDNNRSKSLGGQLALNAPTRLTVILNGMVGPERPNDDRDNRNLLDVVVTWHPIDPLGFGANADLGCERLPAGFLARWSGCAAYARLESRGGTALSLRGEYFDDRGGTRLGVPNLAEFTITPEQRVSPHMILRADARLDHFSQRIFATWDSSATARWAKTQPTVLVSALYSF